MPATAYGPTLDFHRLIAAELPPEDGQDRADAERGFLGTVPDAEVVGADGRVVWSLKPYAFLDDETAAPTVNPSLWRQARLNRTHGLFQVSERIFQVRGFDIANITFIEGDTGLIALDALTVADTAAAALALYRRHRDPEAKRPLHTVMYSHSHGDHFGGVLGLSTQAEVDAGRVQVIAPDGFMHAAVAENVIAGVPMMRRAAFQFGHTLPKGPAHQVDAGLGKTMPAGRPGLIAPTRLITQPFETHVIDGVEIGFQLAPDTEAPAEMHFWFPGERVLNLAENTSHTLHNVCPLRGSQVRDALAWAKHLHQALHRWGDAVEAICAQHHWPTWGRQRCRAFLADQRDLYRTLHDQTVRLMGHGLKAAEIAELLRLPPGVARRWHNRGYYGTVSHNVKAIVQRYLSWYDAHPANLHPLPPVAAAHKTLEYMGGIDAVLRRARADFERGEYRWVAEVMKHAVYAHPGHREARELAAAALEQMGFQAESATWRNAFLLGAHEYREGPPKPMPPGAGFGLVAALPSEMVFDALAIRLDADKAGDLRFTMAWHFDDRGEHWRVEIGNGAMHALALATAPAADVALTLARPTLDAMLTQQLAPAQALADGRLAVAGDAAKLGLFFGLLDRFGLGFPVVDAVAWPPG
ncbi:MAG: MBL fold metallo-hydrolase [Burkholderiales bacterium]|nr:MBL fold metallo-hydrolase [Burkholderiales bacterium]